jgi:hypothetical protein
MEAEEGMQEAIENNEDQSSITLTVSLSDGLHSYIAHVAIVNQIDEEVNQDTNIIAKMALEQPIMVAPIHV